MAKLIIEQNHYDLSDGAPLRKPCEEAGIPFDCSQGICGSCLIRVVDGADNLSALTEEEFALGLDRTRRLACQCRILKDTVSITLG